MQIFVDYKKEVKRLIEETYEPADIASVEVEKTTTDLVQGFRQIISSKQLDLILTGFIYYIIQKWVHNIGFNINMKNF